ncbi:MAG TPA: hypothetical protein VK607_21490 [Kofleriaceae bacterium]|nr:hypothetical protein [Kofleriaceae bacterium]
MARAAPTRDAHRVVGHNLSEYQDLLGWQLHCTESIAHPSSPQMAADASVLSLAPSATASFTVLGCEARRFFASGAQTRRHDTAQSIGMLQPLWMVNATRSSPRSTWSKLVHAAIVRRGRSANAGTAVGMTIEIARAHVAPRTQLAARMADLR